MPEAHPATRLETVLLKSVWIGSAAILLFVAGIQFERSTLVASLHANPAMHDQWEFVLVCAGVGALFAFAIASVILAMRWWATPVPRRRWFQFGVTWWLTLAVVLGVVWWQSVSWPLVVRGWMSPPPETLAVSKTSPGASWKEVQVRRVPTRADVATRGVAGSCVAIIAMLTASVLVRRMSGRAAGQPQSSA
jgi:hypothetical protein